MLLWIACALGATAQNDTSVQRTNNFSAAINYQSRLHYFGRTDSLKSSGLFPTIGFESKTGLYANSSFIFLSNQNKSAEYTGTVVEAGYKFPEMKNFSGNLFYTHFLYKQNSEVVQAALKAQTGINLTYNNKIANLTIGGDAKFSDQTDIGLTAGLDHLFIKVIPATKWAVAINPSAYLYAGTQNFTNTYRKSRQIGGIPIGGQQVVTEEVKKLNVLSYEVSMPLVIVAGKFNASITGSYVMPQNLITNPSRPDLSERGQNMFYVTAGIGVRL